MQNPEEASRLQPYEDPLAFSAYCDKVIFPNLRLMRAHSEELEGNIPGITARLEAFHLRLDEMYSLMGATTKEERQQLQKDYGALFAETALRNRKKNA